MNNYPKLITTNDAAKLLNITPNTLRQWVFRGKIKQVYPGLFDPNQLVKPSPNKRGRKPNKENLK